jgi:hypothetical protein
MSDSPGIDEDIPTGVTHLPQGSQAWALNLTRDVREMKPLVKEVHTDLQKAKFLLKAFPFATAALVGIGEVLWWALSHVHLSP